MYQINFHQSIPVTGNPSVFHLRALVEERSIYFSKVLVPPSKNNTIVDKTFHPLGFRLLISKMRVGWDNLDSFQISLCVFTVFVFRLIFGNIGKVIAKWVVKCFLQQKYTHTNTHTHTSWTLFFVYFCCRKLKLFLFFLLSVSDGNWLY